MSNARIGSQNQVANGDVVRIVGKRQLFIWVLASGGAMISREDVVGATDASPAFGRPAAVVRPPAQGDQPLVGVMGVPRERIRFTAHPDV